MDSTSMSTASWQLCSESPRRATAVRRRCASTGKSAGSQAPSTPSSREAIRWAESCLLMRSLQQVGLSALALALDQEGLASEHCPHLVLILVKGGGEVLSFRRLRAVCLNSAPPCCLCDCELRKYGCGQCCRPL